MSLISSRTPNNIRSPNHITHIIQNRHRTLSVRTLRGRELCRHDRGTSLVNNQSGTWMLILAPTYSTKISISWTVMTTYIIPFVIGMLLDRDSIVGIIIPSSISLPVITHKYRGSQQFSRVEYSTQIYWFNTRGAKEYSQVLAAELSIQPHLET